jgi:4-diphosphocytidyl-2-C-methyl-D-erythritol kinase
MPETTDQSASGRAPAKINLGLRVLGRRDDGYHLLESLFVPIDLADEVRIDLTTGLPTEVGLSLAPAADAAGEGLEAIPEDDRNLAWRAAARFLEATGLAARVRITLTKRIPAAAGLGGGSSDAATVLRLLQELVGAPLSPEALADLALSLGADVPFFLDPKPALVTGIGEHVEPVRDLPALCLLLANPGESLATAAVYGAADVLAATLTPVEPGSTMRALSDLREAGDASTRAAVLEALLRNDLEPAALRLCPPVGRLQKALREGGAQAVGMSGSGATVFGVFESDEAARRCLQGLKRGPRTWARLAVSEGAR